MAKIKPEVIHISMSGRGVGAICGAASEDWQDRYLKDSVAKKLPHCPKCVEMREVILSAEEEE